MECVCQIKHEAPLHTKHVRSGFFRKFVGHRTWQCVQHPFQQR